MVGDERVFGCVTGEGRDVDRTAVGRDRRDRRQVPQVQLAPEDVVAGQQAGEGVDRVPAQRDHVACRLGRDEQVQDRRQVAHDRLGGEPIAVEAWRDRGAC